MCEEYSLFNHMRMMTYKEVARKMGVSEITVKRTVNQERQLRLDEVEKFLGVSNLPSKFYKQREALREVLELYPSDRYLKNLIEGVLCG